MLVADGAGSVAEVGAEDLLPVPHLYPANNQRVVLQTVRVPFAALEGIDTADIRSVSIEVGLDLEPGEITLTDVQLDD